MSNELRSKICPVCGERRMAEYREICVDCEGSYVSDEAYDQLLEELHKDNEERKAAQPQLVPDEVRLNRDIGFNPDKILNSWYMNASYKVHDTSYKERDPFAYKACAALQAQSRDLTKEEREEWNNALKEEAELQTLKINGGYWDKKCPSEYTDEQRFEFMTYRCRPEDTDWSLTYDCSQVKNKATVFYDAEKLANQMPGRSRGYTKYGVKPSCPQCNITVDEYGYCPECNQRVSFQHNSRGHLVAMIGENIPQLYTKPEVAVYWTNNDAGHRVDIDAKIYTDEWLPRDDIKHKYNFIGYANKKSDSRELRTGHQPQELLDENRDPVQVVLSPNIEVIEELQGIFEGDDKKSIRRVKSELKTCPECECIIKLQDLRRGETLCPQCGLVLKQTLYVVESAYGGKDKTGGYEKEVGDVLERGFEVGEL
jgi:transcription initiation factor TFIIIB Brf1 subunit/transcription initiation factor TFIIB